MKIDKFASKMDKFGALAFLFIIIYAIIALINEINLMNMILLLVGIGGFLVDLFVVIKTNLKK